MIRRNSRYTLVILVWFFLGAIPIGLHAQDRYQTDMLKLIADKTGLRQQLDTIKEGEYTHYSQFKSQPITIIVENNRVTHIGFSIFDNNQRQGFGKHICNFLERYFLELAIPTIDHFSTSQRMKEDRVTFLKGEPDPQNLRLLSEDTTVCINLQSINEKDYIMGWRRDSIWQCIISFPIEYDLLIGTNMDERERRLSEELQNEYCYTDSLDKERQDKLIKAWQDNYYTLKGRAYLLENLNGNLYFEKDSDGLFKPIFNTIYPIESLANLFTSSFIKNEYEIEIQMRKYGFITDTICVPLTRWINYCRFTGCKPFFGIIALNEDGISTCELIMYNAELGYNHIMKIWFPLAALETRKGIIKARLNSYVTSSRIKNLFDDNNHTRQ